MPIKNIIEKAEKQFPIDQNITDAIKQAVSNISGGLASLPDTIVYTTGNQTVSGLKTFTTRLFINNTGVLLSGEAARLPDNLVYTTGGQTISGGLSFEADNYFFDGANVYFINNTGFVSGQWGFTNRPTVNGTGVLLSGEAAGLPTTIVYTTGAQTISGTKTFDIRPTVNGTGVLLSGEAYSLNNPSGFITSQNVVFTTGNQILSGSKSFVASRYIFSGANVVFIDNTGIVSGEWSFTNRPTISGTPFLLRGDYTNGLEQYLRNDQGTVIAKALPVYINGANGNNVLFKLASNTGDQTSSKTIGLTKQEFGINSFGYVITEGLLTNVDTSTANDGDPIWLGPTGNLIYGFANKPQAPNHLVFLGVVERAHATQGKIFVKVQNGFEIDELHDVRITNLQHENIIIYNTGSGVWINSGVNFSNFYTNNNPSGFITSQNVVFTTGTQTISGEISFEASEYFFDGANVYFINNTGFVSGQWRFTNRPTVNGTGVLLSGEAAGLPTTIVYTTGAQTISGTKTFDIRPTVNGTGVLLSGEAAGLPTTIVYTTGAQTISGTKTFNIRPTVNGTGVLLSGDTITQINLFVTGVLYTGDNLVYTTGNQTISGTKTFDRSDIIFNESNVYISGSGRFPQDHLINFFHSTTSPTDATRYWIGQIPDLGASTAADTDGRSFPIPVSGIARSMSVNHYVGTNFGNALATETGSFWFVNLTTQQSGRMITGVASNLKISQYTDNINPTVHVKRGDQVSIAWITPTWSAATNPSAIRNTILVQLELL